MIAPTVIKSLRLRQQSRHDVLQYVEILRQVRANVRLAIARVAPTTLVFYLHHFTADLGAHRRPSLRKVLRIIRWIERLNGLVNHSGVNRVNYKCSQKRHICDVQKYAKSIFSVYKNLGKLLAEMRTI